MLLVQQCAVDNWCCLTDWPDAQSVCWRKHKKESKVMRFCTSHTTKTGCLLQHARGPRHMLPHLLRQAPIAVNVREVHLATTCKYAVHLVQHALLVGRQVDLCGGVKSVAEMGVCTNRKERRKEREESTPFLLGNRLICSKM